MRGRFTLRVLSLSSTSRGGFSGEGQRERRRCPGLTCFLVVSAKRC